MEQVLFMLSPLPDCFLEIFLGPRGPLGLPSLVRPFVRPWAQKIWISCIAL